MTVASGLAKPPTGTQAAVWTDIDNDGFARPVRRQRERPGPAVSQQARRHVRGHRRRRPASTGAAFNKGVAAADYDNDGWPDLYVSNLGGTNFLYHNNRDGTFTGVGAAPASPGPGQGFPTWFFDYDNDGCPGPVRRPASSRRSTKSARAYLRLPRNGNTLKLYRNLGDGSFQDVTRQAGLDKVLMPMGANFGDIDNDGFLDIYLGTGNPSYASLVPSLLLRNKGRRSRSST